MQRAAFLKSWRGKLGLSPTDVAHATGLSEHRIAQAEGGAELSLDELESLARVLGLRGEQLYDENVKPAAATDVLRVLFKSAEGLKPPPQARLALLGAARAALDLLELHDELKLPKPALPRPDLRRVARESLHQLGRRQARAVRQHLSLHEGEIASMRDLLAVELRIPVLAGNLGVYGPDAFTLFSPSGRVAVVLNVDGKHENHLVRRFSLAHELGHVCGDRPALGGSGIACLVDSQATLDLETRANAFAINLLLPQEVEREKERLLDAAHFRATMEKWGVHFAALRLYTQKQLGLTDEQIARRCPRVDSGAPLHIREAEELEAERSALHPVPLVRRGELSRLVLEEFADGRLRAGRARELLRVDATVDLVSLLRAAGLR